MSAYYNDRQFKGENFAEQEIAAFEYENCTFINCVFTKADLSQTEFENCEFEDCDLSLAKLQGTAFRDVTFTNCKLLGLHFENCNNFSLSFTFKNCVLNFASFYKMKLKNICFEDCKLEETDFVETDLTKAVFKNCELKRASFSQTILDGADLRTAFNFSIDPETNRIKKAKFSTHNIAGLLDKYSIVIE